jgi:hypothetical protein
MKARTKTVLFALLMSALMAGGKPRPASLAEDVPARKRIRFQVATIEEGAGGRKVISSATIEGPPGTDFVIDLQSRRFKMNARFLTELISPGELKVSAKLNTRRLYGYSQNNLPLYEEDNQSETLQLGFEEQVVLLPFGKGSRELLKVEVTPSMSDQPVYLASGEMQPPAINISEPSPGGLISIHALKIPHAFVVEALLLEDGREVARGESPCLIEEAQEILLQPNERASSDVANNPLLINLTIAGYEQNRSLGEAAISFDVHSINKQENSAPQPVARNWAGIAVPGSAMDYDLNDHYLKSSGKKYELRFRVKIAATAN